MSEIYFFAVGMIAVFVIMVALRTLWGWRAWRDWKAHQPAKGEEHGEDRK